MVYGQALIQAIYRTCLAGDSETPCGTTLVTHSVLLHTDFWRTCESLYKSYMISNFISLLCHHDNEIKDCIYCTFTQTRGLIYKLLRRNHPKFDLTIISRICVRRTNRKRAYASLSDVKSMNRKWSSTCTQLNGFSSLSCKRLLIFCH